MTFNDFILNNEMPIRLGFFFGVFGLMALWERISPRRQLHASKAVRWANNLGLVFFNSFILRLLFPAAAVGMALFAGEQGWGLFNYFEKFGAVVVDGRPYLVDCGYGALGALRESGLGFRDLSTIFITHLHDDHTSETGHQQQYGRREREQSDDEQNLDARIHVLRTVVRAE